MTYNQRFGYGQNQGYYPGQDIKAIAYRHLTTALIITSVIILAINVIFYNDYTNPMLVSLYIIGSIVEVVILLAMVVISLFRLQLSESTATIILYVFAVASSLSFAYIVLLTNTLYVNGLFLVTLSFGIGGVVTFGMYAYTSANKPDTTALQRKMMFVGIAIFLFALIGFFIYSGCTIFELVLRAVFGVFFASFMYIDFARLERRQFASPAMMALMLFIDIIYFIQNLLELLTILMGQRR